MKRRWLMAAALAVCMAFPGVAQPNDERILEFRSHIRVNSDRTLNVTETIRVNCLGQQIQRGIFRALPYTYRDRNDRLVAVSYNVVQTTRDGLPEPFHTESDGEYLKVYIGKPDYFLSPGEYTYEIAYSTNRQIHPWDELDELYWNITGNEWSFAMDAASVTIHLPQAVREEDLVRRCFIGPRGSIEESFESWIEPDGAITFAVTRPLAPMEGFTVRVGFPKGIVEPPSLIDTLLGLDRAGLPRATAVVGTLLVLIYLIVVWARVGKDPEGGPIRVQVTPPNDLSPAAARYIWRMGFDHKTITAALLSLAVKGRIRIEEAGDSFRIWNADTAHEALAPEEEALIKKLISKGQSISLTRGNQRRIASAGTACHNSLRLQFEKRYFLTNSKYLWPAAIGSLVTVAAVALASPISEGAPVLFFALWLSIWSLGVFFLLNQVRWQWQQVFAHGTGWGEAMFISLFAAPFVAAEILVFGVMVAHTGLDLMACVAVHVALLITFYVLLKAPTPLGRAALDELEGFRRFLQGEELGPMAVNRDARIADRADRHLPYAVALDVEDDWGRRFDAALDAAGKPAVANAPAWYLDSSTRDFDRRRFASNIGNSLTSAYGRASTPKPSSSSGGGSSSSGSSGGGSSGGGGGGGGGGGW